jgi:hypothetical protein
MRRNLRLLTALALIATVALLSAGCSHGSAQSGAGSSANASSARDKAVKYSECMRDHGLSAFPDPDSSGQLTLDGVLNGSSLDPDSAVFKKAITACKDLQPAGFTGSKSRSTKAQKAALAFARCVRANGVKDFPDPVDGEPLVNTNRIPSTNDDGGMSALNAAMHKCRNVLGDTLKDQ